MEDAQCDDQNPCTVDKCQVGHCSNEAAGGAACGTTPCVGDTECDDENPCTVDTCASGICANVPAAAGTTCGTAAACETAAACDGASVCAPGMPIGVDDGDPCTADACDASSGMPTHTTIPLCWSPLPSTGAPSARANHTAVWTGSKMLVWGGNVDGTPPVTATGASYDPAAKVWAPLSTTGAPSARAQHAAVWTGSKMIVWGGSSATGYVTDGGLYDPVADTWTAMTTVNAPAGRSAFASVWTGSVLVVWGGLDNDDNPLGDGGAYDPATDTWTALPASGAPSPRYGHTAVPAGNQVIFWGGYNLVDWLASGITYDPVAAAWLTPTPSAGAPEYRQRHGAVWTGSQMVVWGGADPNNYIGTGGALDPVAGTWITLTNSGAPSPRADPTTLWTGAAMFVWGGCGGQMCDVIGDGGLWTSDASGGSWQAIAASPAISARHAHAAVWTGASALVWGGLTGTARTDTGAMFTP